MLLINSLTGVQQPLSQNNEQKRYHILPILTVPEDMVVSQTGDAILCLFDKSQYEQRSFGTGDYIDRYDGKSIHTVIQYCTCNNGRKRMEDIQRGSLEVEKPCTLFWFYLSFLYSIYSANLVSLSRSPWNPTGWSSEDEDPQVWVAQCFRCKEYSVWHKGKMIYPSEGIAPLPHPDLPDDEKDHIKNDYLEARTIVSQSPRGAAALLRLAIQKLVDRIVEERKLPVKKNQKDLNGKIGLLVRNGLRKKIQQPLDYVRVVGNNAVHPLGKKQTSRTILRLLSHSLGQSI